MVVISRITITSQANMTLYINIGCWCAFLSGKHPMSISDSEQGTLLHIGRLLKKEEQIDELTEKAEHLLLESEQLESSVGAAITTGAPDSDVAASALAAEEASSTAFLALGNALEASSTTEKADREQDERGAVNASKRKKQTSRRITWTAEVDEAITHMIADGST
jgi:hypothetical protein